ncbi:hypothetical protein RI367_002818 [Sorochytrium milnesiophthora]
MFRPTTPLLLAQPSIYRGLASATRSDKPTSINNNFEKQQQTSALSEPLMLGAPSSFASRQPPQQQQQQQQQRVIYVSDAPASAHPSALPTTLGGSSSSTASDVMGVPKQPKSSKGNRMRRRTSVSERQYLESIYAKVKKPDSETRKKIAEEATRTKAGLIPATAQPSHDEDGFQVISASEPPGSPTTSYSTFESPPSTRPPPGGRVRSMSLEDRYGSSSAAAAAAVNASQARRRNSLQHNQYAWFDAQPPSFASSSSSLADDAAFDMFAQQSRQRASSCNSLSSTSSLDSLRPYADSAVSGMSSQHHLPDGGSVIGLDANTMVLDSPSMLDLDTSVAESLLASSTNRSRTDPYPYAREQDLSVSNGRVRASTFPSMLSSGNDASQSVRHRKSPLRPPNTTVWNMMSQQNGAESDDADFDDMDMTLDILAHAPPDAETPILVTATAPPASAQHYQQHQQPQHLVRIRSVPSSLSDSLSVSDSVAYMSSELGRGLANPVAVNPALSYLSQLPSAFTAPAGRPVPSLLSPSLPESLLPTTAEALVCSTSAPAAAQAVHSMQQYHQQPSTMVQMHSFQQPSTLTDVNTSSFTVPSSFAMSSTFCTPPPTSLQTLPTLVAGSHAKHTSSLSSASPGGPYNFELHSQPALIAVPAPSAVYPSQSSSSMVGRRPSLDMSQAGLTSQHSMGASPYVTLPSPTTPVAPDTPAHALQAAFGTPQQYTPRSHPLLLTSALAKPTAPLSSDVDMPPSPATACAPSMSRLQLQQPMSSSSSSLSSGSSSNNNNHSSSVLGRHPHTLYMGDPNNMSGASSVQH